TEAILALHLPLCPSRVIRTIDEIGWVFGLPTWQKPCGGEVKDGERFGCMWEVKRGDRGGYTSLDVASTVSAACIVVAGSFVSAGIDDANNFEDLAN
ncbi:hypothetical protein Tco_1472096, partial [Tanacetum coccineum]